jgi:predicted ATPase
VTVLATSRARLMVPFERVYPVPPLSLVGGGESDAVALFVDRAAAVGPRPDPAQRRQIASVCERLDGMALAIELAAARSAALGLDGLTAGLSDPLRMLAGGSRADDRHRSVSAALDWSYALLDPADRVLLCRVSLFVAPFTLEAAAEVAASDVGAAADGLARLTEQSLLVVMPSTSGTRYRALETIREYGARRLADGGELLDARARHLGWCLANAADLTVRRDDWRVRFDLAADDLRAALAWAADRPERRPDAHGLARRLAELTFTRNLVGESQHRFEQAAELAGDATAEAMMLRHAAAVAGCRMRGDDRYRLYRAAADAARRSGDTAGAARDLATAATDAFRFSGTFTRLPSPEEAVALIAEARTLAGEDPATRAALALAEAAVLTDAFGAIQGPSENAVPQTLARAKRAVELANRAADPLLQSAALDALLGAQSWAGDTFAVAATARRRIALLAPVPDSPARTDELIDALGEAAEASLGAGDLTGARSWARQLADHPLLAEVGHRATSWLLVADALTGDAEEMLTAGVRFRESWQRTGRPATSAFGPAVCGMAMMHGLRGDDDAREEWAAILNRLDTSPGQSHGYGAVFDGILLLHRGQAPQALERMSPEPADVWKWITWIWLHWYVSLRAEASVLARSPAARGRLTEARTVVAGNPVAAAIVERAAALLDDDRQRLLDAANAFEVAGCRYQWARTMILAGGEHAALGAAALGAIGIVPMAGWPREERVRAG